MLVKEEHDIRAIRALLYCFGCVPVDFITLTLKIISLGPAWQSDQIDDRAWKKMYTLREI